LRRYFILSTSISTFPIVKNVPATIANRAMNPKSELGLVLIIAVTTSL